LPGGKESSIVDVPGHERFIKNMLAGVGSIDMALLVIAADEGIMPQTREHLAILDLLYIGNGIIVITKKDLVDNEWLNMVSSDIKDLVKGTTLEKAPVLSVSAITGEGLKELLSTIENLLGRIEPRKDVGRPRLPIDRIFTISGFGSVVTGTLIDGRFSVGQEVEIVPRELKSRIRGLQMHKQKLETVMPGSRVAINLTGLSVSDLQRGDVVTVPGWLQPTIAFDARIRTVKSISHNVKHNSTVSIYTGASESMAKIRLLEKESIEPGESSLVQIRLAVPLPVVKGDFFIIRSSWETLGGGEIIDPMARRHRRFNNAIIQNLAALETGGDQDIILKLLDSGGIWDVDELIKRSGLSLDQVKKALDLLGASKNIITSGNNVIFSISGWNRFVQTATDIVSKYHNQYPLRGGMLREELKSRLKLKDKVFHECIKKLTDDKKLIESGSTVKLTEFEIKLTPVQGKIVAVFLDMLNQNAYSPNLETIPSDSELVNMLIEQGKIVKAAENVIFSKQAYDDMVAKIIQELKKNGKITVAEVRNLFSTSRKYALALMEHLDEKRITRRVGDERVLR
ncbi:MAG: selenocysteine-specific translation elongation factor, partial [Chloroflexi bacterium]|nr:selenocysteine-specific translation elongation factor [Chloroflexota bacterium]